MIGLGWGWAAGAVNDVLTPIAFADLRNWEADDHAAALSAFRMSAEAMLAKPYKERVLSPSIEDMAAVAARAMGASAAADPRGFFEDNFAPMRVERDGFLTGFFEPVIRASRERSAAFPVPVLRRPDDLVEVKGTSRPSSWPEDIHFGLQTVDGLTECPDRVAIQDGALDGQGLELAWLADPVDAFFIHVQGAAKLDLDPTLSADDPARFMRITFDGKSGHAYTSLAKLICERDGIMPQDMTADRLADYMRGLGAEIWSLLAQNRSYIFFRQIEGQAASDGPIAAAKVPLQPGRSLAMDRTLHMFGTPVWCETDEPLPEDETPFARLLTMHDTGSAITGPARGDLFVGSGEEAGLTAGRIRHRARFVMLHPTPRS